MSQQNFVRRRFLKYCGYLGVTGAVLPLAQNCAPAGSLKSGEGSSGNSKAGIENTGTDVEQFAAQSGIVSVVDFGAVAGGQEDATEAFQKAIDFAHNGMEGEDKGIVFVPPGRYLIDPARGLRVHDGTQLMGSGISQTEIVASSTAAGSLIYHPYQRGYRTQYVQIRDLRIVLGGDQQTAIDFSHIGRSMVERCYITTQTRYSEKSYGRITHRGGVGIKMQVTRASSSSEGYVGGEVNTVRDCHIVAMNTGILIDGGHSHLIERCDIMEVGTAIKSVRKGATSLKIRSCTLQYAHGGYCVELSGLAFLVEGCYFETSGDSLGAVFLSSESEGCVVKNNMIFSSLGGQNELVDQGAGNSWEANLIK